MSKARQRRHPRSTTILMRRTYGAAILIGALATSPTPAQDPRALEGYIDAGATAAVAEHRTAGVSVEFAQNGRTIVAKR